MLKDAKNLESVHIWSISTILENMFQFNEHHQSLKIWQSLIADQILNHKPNQYRYLNSQCVRSGHICSKRPSLPNPTTFEKFHH